MASTVWSIFMLVLVLALIPLVLWALKRVQTFRPGGANRQLEVTAQLALGARERLVLVRVHDRVLVLGVTPQQISLLTETAAGSGPLADAQAPAASAFAGLLRTMATGPARKSP
jgi:flagellar protein FliO/FliZ